MNPTRRDFVIGTGAALAATQLTAEAAAATQDAAAEKLLAGFTEELLVEYPESATMLGIDKGARRRLKTQAVRPVGGGAEGHCDRRRAGGSSNSRPWTRRRWVRRRASMSTSCAPRTSSRSKGLRFPYGDVALLNSQWSWRNAPYVVAQNTGAFLEIPGMLDEQHTVQTREDADAYLARLEAYAGQLDGETGRLHSAAAQNVIAPDFLLDKTLNQIKLARGGRHRAVVAGHFARRNAPRSLPGDFAAQRREDRRRQDCARARPPDRRARGASRAAPTATPVSGNFRAATSTTPGHCAPARPRA